MVGDNDERPVVDQTEDDLHQLEGGAQQAYNTGKNLKNAYDKYNDLKNGNQKNSSDGQNDNSDQNKQNGNDQKQGDNVGEKGGKPQQSGPITGGDAAKKAGEAGVNAAENAGAEAAESATSTAAGATGGGTTAVTTSTTTAATTGTTTATTTAAGTTAGSAVPGIGNAVGAAVGLAAGVAISMRDKIIHALIAIAVIFVVIIAAIVVAIPSIITGNIFRTSGDNATYSLDSSQNLVIDTEDQEKYNKDSYEYGKMNSKGLVDSPYTDSYLDTQSSIADILADGIDAAYGEMEKQLKNSGVNTTKAALKSSGESGSTLFVGNKESASGAHYVINVNNQAKTTSMIDVANIMAVYSVSMNNKTNLLDYEDTEGRKITDNSSAKGDFDFDGTNIKDMQKKLKKQRDNLYSVTINVNSGENIDEEIYVDTEYLGLDFSKGPVSFSDYCNADGSVVNGAYYYDNALVTKKTKDPENSVENVQSKSLSLYKSYYYNYVVFVLRKGDAGFPAVGNTWTVPINDNFYHDSYGNTYCTGTTTKKITASDTWVYFTIPLSTYARLHPESSVRKSGFSEVSSNPVKVVTVYYNAGDHNIEVDQETIHWQPATATITGLDVDSIWDAFFTDKIYVDVDNPDDMYFFTAEDKVKKYYSQNEDLNKANDALGEQEAHHGNIFGKNHNGTNYKNWFYLKKEDESGTKQTVKTVFLSNKADALTGANVQYLKYMNTDETNKDVVESTMVNMLITITGSDDPAMWAAVSQSRNSNWTVIRSKKGVIWRCVPDTVMINFQRKDEPITTADPNVTFSPQGNSEANLKALAEIFEQADITDVTSVIEMEKGYLKIEKTTSGEHCDVPAGKSFKSWTNYVDSIGRSTPNWALLTGEGTWTDDDGFRRNAQNDYFVALGSYYTNHEIGARFLIETATGNKFTVQICDEKADRDTDELNQYTVATNDACEFYVDSTLNNKVKVSGDCSSMTYLNGAITSITRLDVTGGSGGTGATVTKVEYWYSYDYYNLAGQGNGSLVGIALPQVGDGASLYQNYMGVPSGTAWCACFVSWCMGQAVDQGLIDPSRVYKSASCTDMATWYKNHGWWEDWSSGYTPVPGDIILYVASDWGYGHIGVVESYDPVEDIIHTIEGNTSDGNGGPYIVRQVRRANTSHIGGYITAFTTYENLTVSQGRSLGVFKCTAYCGCVECSEGFGKMTATGVTAKANHTIAVDPKEIPYGTEVVINGKKYKAEDCGGGVKGKHIDIFFDNHSETEAFGVQYFEVFRAE